MVFYLAGLGLRHESGSLQILNLQRDASVTILKEEVNQVFMIYLEKAVVWSRNNLKACKVKLADLCFLAPDHPYDPDGCWWGSLEQKKKKQKQSCSVWFGTDFSMSGPWLDTWTHSFSLERDGSDESYEISFLSWRDRHQQKRLMRVNQRWKVKICALFRAFLNALQGFEKGISLKFISEPVNNLYNKMIM